MWAQLFKMRVPAGNEDKLLEINNQWEAQVGRGTDSGWLRSLIFRATANPNEWYEVVLFESEEKARANERSQKHQVILAQMTPLMDGDPEYVDLTPVQESSR
jgi:antibiotic biosynthesis monooxygenase (ABM) superfamily enzyme